MTKKIKLRISFTGIAGNALRYLWELQELAKHHEDYDEFSNAAYAVESCISAYRDTILAICKGDLDIETAKDFWFHNENVSSIPYDGKAIKFTAESEAV